MPGPGFIGGKPWFKNGLPVFGSGQGCGGDICQQGYPSNSVSVDVNVSGDAECCDFFSGSFILNSSGPLTGSKTYEYAYNDPPSRIDCEWSHTAIRIVLRFSCHPTNGGVRCVITQNPTFDLPMLSEFHLNTGSDPIPPSGALIPDTITPQASGCENGSISYYF